MWKEILLNYGIFLLELLTVFGAIALIVLAIVQSKKQSESGSVVLTDFSENYKNSGNRLKHSFKRGRDKTSGKKRKEKGKGGSQSREKAFEGGRGEICRNAKIPPFCVGF